MQSKLLPELTSSPAIQRYAHNPILCAKDIPYDATLIFNAGVAKYHGKYLMVFRNDYNLGGPYSWDTSLGFAQSADGIHWDVRAQKFFSKADIKDPDITRFYDPRLTVIDDRIYMCFAADTHHGVRGGIAVLDENLQGFKVISLSLPDNRNMVLFPEKVGGMYVRLERPFPKYGRSHDRFDTWISKSPDLVHWGEASLLLPVETVPFANDKTGPAAPPIRTDAGWLTLFHAVDIDETRGKNGWENVWQKRYCAGIMLLDLEHPEKVIGMSRTPLIAPEAPYETQDGFRNHVVFPGGMILEESGEVKIYYGAADTVECLATAHVDDLLALCEPV